jgi:hypothetical protein
VGLGVWSVVSKSGSSKEVATFYLACKAVAIDFISAVEFLAGIKLSLSEWLAKWYFKAAEPFQWFNDYWNKSRGYGELTEDVTSGSGAFEMTESGNTAGNHEDSDSVLS